MHITIQLEDGEIMVPSYQITLQKERSQRPFDSNAFVNTLRSTQFSMGSTATAMPFSNFTTGNRTPPESSSSEDDDDSTTDYPTSPTMPTQPTSSRESSRLERLTERLRRNILASTMEEAADLLTEDLPTENRNPTDPAEYLAETDRRAEGTRLENEMFDRNLGPATNPAGENDRLSNYMTQLGYPASYVAAMQAGARGLPPEIPIEPDPIPEPTYRYYMRTPKQSLLISKGEYERVQGILRQLNLQEIRDMEDKIKIEEVKKSWSGKNPALFGFDLAD